MLAASRGEWLASRPDRFTLEEKGPSSRQTGGSAVPKQSGRLEKRDYLLPLR
jgi:hypothetical protein